MGARIRAHDWSGTPLGAAKTWPQSLKITVSIMLGANSPMAIYWGPDLILLYNDQWEALIGGKYPSALGRPAREVFPELWETIGPTLTGVLMDNTGENARDHLLPLNRNGRIEEAWFYSYNPIPLGDGSAGGILNLAFETTKHILAKCELRANEARQAFLLAVSDRLRPLAEPRAIMAAAARALGEHLGVGCVGYSEADASGELVTVERDWTAPGAVSVAGVHRLDSYGPAMIAALRAGHTVRVDDVARSPLTDGMADAYEAIRTRAFVGAPLVKAGRLAAILFVLSEQPRAWTDAEVALIESIAERTWAALEQAGAETALRESEERLRALVSASSEVMYRMSPDWSEMRQLSGGGFLSDTASPNRVWLADYIHPDDQPRVMAAIREAVRTKGVFEFEHRVRRADGSLGWTFSRAVPLLDAAGEIKEWFGAASDVTMRKEAEEALRRLNETLEAQVETRTAALRRALDALHVEALERAQAEEALHQAQKMEALGQLTGGIAHDFNNMLQAIGGSLELGRRRVAQGRAGEVTRYIEAARKTVERAAALTHRLLAFARRQALQPRAVEPDALINDIAELIRRTVGPGVAVELRLRDGAWSVLCDPNQLENVLLNLAINARDAMPEGGSLTIGSEDVCLGEADITDQEGARAGDYVEIAVADTGVGMDEATQAHAFEPFFTTKPIGQGTGLGLSQVYGFVRQSGGFVRLASAPGRGTTVRLYLPRHKRSQGPQAQSLAVEPERTGAGKAVLLVEDEADVRTQVAEQLRELGYQVLEAADGPAALLVLCSSAHVDVLVTDVGLPGGLNGRQVADVARERRPGLPVLFITGYAGGPLHYGAALEPGMEMMNKPFALDELAAKVRALTGAPPPISASPPQPIGSTTNAA